MKVLQINTSVNLGSTGRIAEDIGRLIQTRGHESYIAFGRNSNESLSNLIKIGNRADQFCHLLKSRIIDRHSFGSTNSTKSFIREIKQLNPDIIHLHNLHGYYLNIKVLFDYFKVCNKPIVWTFHDCWPFTGHCSYYDAVNCSKWQRVCKQCPNLNGYPKSWFWDSSEKNFQQKRSLFTGASNLTIITPSHWLAGNIRHSFLKNVPVNVIHNGTDINVFRPGSDNILSGKFDLFEGDFILGVANTWDKRKGLGDFIRLRNLLPKHIGIILVGLKPKQIKNLPNGIKGITRTGNKNELARLYSEALVFVNPTYVDNFPTTNIEALACGTPVITYNTGGSPEAINKDTGIIIEKGDLPDLVKAINMLSQKGKSNYSVACRKRAELLFDKEARFEEYLTLYQSLIKK